MPAFRKSQQGEIAIMVGLTLVILAGMPALMIDLGHVYFVKTGLQNGADAATQKAIDMARHNNYAFSKPVGTSDDDGELDLFVGRYPA